MTWERYRLDIGVEKVKSKQDALYTIGEFASKAGVTLRTLRYYDKINLLKPSTYSEAGHRMYTKNDFATLQKILTLKFIGLSLDEIENIMKEDIHDQDFQKSLDIQKKIMEQKVHHLKLVINAIDEARQMVDNDHVVNWDKFINIISVINVGSRWIEQYKNASNLQARIRIHEQFSTNHYGWMRWFFEQIHIPDKVNILELGCGDGSLWVKNIDRIPTAWNITLTDFSEGMLQDAKKALGKNAYRFNFKLVDAQAISYEKETFDVVFANHMLYHVPDREQAFSEIWRVLKPGGYFYASTVGQNHLAEMRDIVARLDVNAVATTSKNLTEEFQLENGCEQVSKWFDEVKIKRYEDSLNITEAGPLLDYIFSMPGNHKEIFNQEDLEEFIGILEEEIKQKGAIFITKDTGFFEGRKYRQREMKR